MVSRVAHRRASLASSALLAVCISGPALAQPSSPAQSLLDANFVFNVGGFAVSTDLKGRLNGSAASNPDVDFDKSFGRGGDANRGRADALWRITPAHHVRLMYFNDTRTNKRALTEDIKWGDYTFLTGSSVELQTKQSIAELAYEYAFVRQPTYEVAGTFGVHYTESQIKLSGAATVTDANGNVTSVAAATTSKTLPVPLPVLGLRAGWAVAPQWYLEAQGQWFKANVDGYDGKVTDIRANATWMFSQNFGLGLGYNRFSTRLSVDRPAFDGKLNMGYAGVQIFLTGAF